MIHNRAQGFTAVELLIAIVVGALLVASAYQLYSVVLASSGDAQRKAVASNLAYSTLRSSQSMATSPCTTSSSNPSVPADRNLPSATMTVSVTCPYGSIDVSNITVTVSYDSPNTKQVSRAITVAP